MRDLGRELSELMARDGWVLVAGDPYFIEWEHTGGAFRETFKIPAYSIGTTSRLSMILIIGEFHRYSRVNGVDIEITDCRYDSAQDVGHVPTADELAKVVKGE